MTNNNTHQATIDLFPDNVDNEITARDLRTGFNNVFNDTETQIVKLPSLSDLPTSTNIYEGTLVIIYQEEIGIYLSTRNQPQTSLGLIKIA